MVQRFNHFGFPGRPRSVGDPKVRNKRRRRDRAFSVAFEALEPRILFTWIGAVTGNTFDAAHNYNNTANWVGGVIDDSFAGVTFTGNTTIFFSAARTTGAGGLNLGYSGNFNLTFMSSTATTQTLTLAGDVSSGVANQSVTLGDVTNTDNLNVVLTGATRTFNTAGGESLAVVNAVSGVSVLAAAGTGSLTLSGANSYTGGTTLTSGQLDINSATALGTNRLTINGGTIDNTSGAAVTLTNNNLQTWGADFTFVGSNALNLGTGAVTLGANRTVTVSSSILSEGGIIAGAFSLTKAGAGALTLSGANTFTGGTILSAGQLNLNAAKAPGTGRLTINGGTIDNTSGAAITLSNNNVQTWGGDFTFVGSNSLNLGNGAVTLGANRIVTVSGSTWTEGGIVAGAFSVTKAGAGVLTLSGANTFTGGTTLSAGQLNINAAKAVGTGTFAINGGTIDNTSGGAITLSNNNVQTWGGDFTFVGSNVLNLGTGAVTLGASRSVTASASTLTVGGAIGDSGSGFVLTKLGAGTIALTATNTFSGGDILDAGILSFANGALGSGNITFGGNSTLQWNGANTQDISSKIQSIATGILATFDTNGNNVTLASVLSGNGGIAKIGAGALTLSGTNLFAGGATISVGTLNINNAAAIGSGTFTINGGTIDNSSAGAITLSNNNAETWGASFTFTGTNALNLGNGAITLSANVTVTDSASTLTSSGAIGDGGGGFLLTKSGNGTFTLSGNNTFSGGAKVTAGLLNINSATAVGSGTLSLNGGTIDNTSGVAIALSNNNVISIGGNFTFTGSNALNLGTGAVTLTASRTITANASILTIGGAIGDGGSGFQLTKGGNGTLTLSGNSTFSGGLKFNTGALNINSATAIGSGLFTIAGTTIDNTSGAAITLSNNNAVALNANFTFTGTNNLNLGTGAETMNASRTITVTGGMLTLGGPIGDGGGGFKITKAGNGTLTLAGSNTFSGGVLLTVGQLNINSATAIGTGAFTITTGTIDNTSGAAVTLTGNNAETWNGNFTFVGSSDLSLGTGAITLGANPTITVSGGDLTVNGVVSGAHSIVKNGAGALTLGGANLYTTGTTLSAGQLNINNATALDTGALTIGGGSIDNTSGAAITLTTNNAQTWNGDFTFVGSNALNMGTGAVTLGANRIVTASASTLTEGGIIAGAFSLTKAGTGALTLTGANTFTGGTTLSAGTLNINNAKAVGTARFTINGGTIDNTSGGTISLFNNNVQTWGGNFTFGGTNALNLGTGAVTLGSSSNVTLTAGSLTVGGIIADGGNGFGVTESGAGTLTLSGVNTFSGGTTVSGGQLNINNAAAVGTGTLTIGLSTIDNTSGGAITLSNNNAVAWNSNFTFVGTSNLNLGTGALTLGASNSVTVSSGTLTIGGVIGDAGHAFKITKAGAGTLTLNAANTFSGGTTLSAGLLNIGNAAAIGSGTFTLNGGTFDNTSGGAMTLSNNNTEVWGGSFTFTGTNNLNLGTGAVTLSSSASLTVFAGTLTDGGIIGDGGGGIGFTKSGAGTLTLSGASTFSGGTTLNAGQLNLNNATAIGSGTFTIAGGTIDNTSGAAITLSNNNSVALNSSFTFVGSSNLNLGTGASTLGGNSSVAVSAGTLVIGGAIGDGGGGFKITKTGAGTLTLSGNSTFSGGTTLSAGQLNINNAAAIGSGAFIINGGTIDNTSGSAITLSNNNLQTWGGNFTFVGSSDLNLGTGAVTLGASRIVTTTAGTLTVGGAIGDGGSGFGITKAGAGTLTVTGSSTFSGGVSINAGTLMVNDASGSGTGSGAVTVSSGTTLGGTGTASGAVTVNSGGTLAPGAGGTAIFSTGNLILASGSNLDIAMNGNTAGSGYDQINVTGSVALTGSNLNLSGTRTAHDGTVLTIINNDASDTVTGTFSGLAEGATSVFSGVTYTASYVGGSGNDAVLTADLASTTTTVASGTNPTVFGQSITFTAHVSSSSSGTPTGSVTFMDGATSLGTGTLNGSDDATFNTSALTVGSHSITAVYGGDTDFAVSTSTTLGQTVNQDATSTSIVSSSNPSAFGQSVTFTATVSAVSPGSGTATGIVVFRDAGTTLGTGMLNGSGVATFTTSSLSVGGHSILAAYAGDANFSSGASSAVSQTVDQDATTTSVTSSANPSAWGQSVTFTATVAASAPGSGIATGIVTFIDGSTVLGTGTLNGSDVATFSTSSLGIGAHSVTAVYGGDSSYSTSGSSILPQTVNQSATTSSLSSSANPSVFGQSVTFTATIAAVAPGVGTPTGMVTFMDGATLLGTGTLDGSGVATFISSSLGVGGHSITAVYGGDTDFTSSTSSAVSQTVNQDATTTSLGSSANPSVFGQSITFTATVAATAPGSGTASGIVTFEDGATVLGAGTLNGSDVATFTTSNLSVANHSITAVYAGDAGFGISTSSAVSQTVNQDATTTVLTSSVSPSVSGQSVIFTATVSSSAPGSGTATGMVTFKDGSTVLGTGTLDGSGVGTFTTSGLSVASHLITAVYGGDTDFTSSTSSAVTQIVNQDGTSASISSSANPSSFGQSVTFTATVATNAPGSGIATGMVTFNDGATVLGTGTLNGSGIATFTTSGLNVASHSITAVYGGDANFVSSTSPALTQLVNLDATGTSLSSSVNPSVFGQSVTFTATVAASAPGAGTATGMVTFKDGSTVLGTGTLNGSGVTTFTTSGLSAAIHSITAVYAGDTGFAGSTSLAVTQAVTQDGTSTSIGSSVNPASFGQLVTFTATVAVSAPGAGMPTGMVTFMDGSKSLGTGTLNGSGIATLATSGLSVGGHSITAVYDGDANFSTSTSSALAQTVDQTSTTSTIASSVNPSAAGQSVTFTATVIANSPGSGTPTGLVTFFDAATPIGTGTLNGSGAATFSIASLGVGSHSITAAYDGDADFTASTSSAVSQSVVQTLVMIVVTPNTSGLNENQTQQFSAVGYDGLGSPLVIQPSFTWSMASGVGSIDSTGLYNSGGIAGNAVIQAVSGPVTATANITVTNAAPTVATSASATPNIVMGTTTVLNVLGADDGGESNLTYTWAAIANPAGSGPRFSINATNSSKITTVTFNKSGNYVFRATISDGVKTVTSIVNVQVGQTYTGVRVTPSSTSLNQDQRATFSAIGYDQFGLAMASQPGFVWSVDGGGTGAIDNHGIYTAGLMAGTATVRATGGGLDGTAGVTVNDSGWTELPTAPTGTPSNLFAPPPLTSGPIATALAANSWAATDSVVAPPIWMSGLSVAAKPVENTDDFYGLFAAADENLFQNTIVNSTSIVREPIAPAVLNQNSSKDAPDDQGDDDDLASSAEPDNQSTADISDPSDDMNQDGQTSPPQAGDRMPAPPKPDLTDAN